MSIRKDGIMTLRECMIAQINHQETEFVPYNFRILKDAKNYLTEYYGSEEWEDKLLNPIYEGPNFFDSWDTMREIDPNDPTKKVDAYGNLWTQTEKIAHLDRNGMFGVEPEDYEWPTLKDFMWEGRQEILDEWNENIPEDKFTMISLGAGHWELTWRLLGVEEAFIMCIAEPERFDYVIGKLDELLNQFLDVLLQTRVDAILISDDWCDQRTCTMGAERWRTFIKPRLAKIYQRIHDSGKYVVNHVCGNVTPLIPDLVEIGLDVLESVQPEAMDVYEIKRMYGDKLAFYGALGCQHLTNFGTPEEIRAEIRKLRREMSKEGGYILSTAKPIEGIVPKENVVAIYEGFIEENDKF